MAKNDYNRLKEEAEISEVIEALGIQTYGAGKNKFIHCPLPGHNDKNPTNCFFQKGWNNVYCSRCGKSIKSIDLIMYTAGLSYGDAADMLWEIEGRPSWYYAKRDFSPKTTFTISGEEAKLLGIHLPHGVEQFVSPKELEEVTPTGRVESKRIPAVWQDFMDELTFKKFIRQKCEAKIAVYDEVENLFQMYGLISAKTELFQEERKRIKKIKERCA